MEALSYPVEILEPLPASAPLMPTDLAGKISQQEIRSSLKASTLDGVFAAVFSSITGGVLLTNFLLQMGAGAVEIGLLSSIPMLLNLLQPLGAYFADRATSRRLYSLWLFGASRLLWVILVLEIGWISCSNTDPHRLVSWILGMVLATNILAALGTSSWLSWMTALVPHQLRGRYFGRRNSAASLTTLLCVPLLGFAMSVWPSGTVQGYGVVLWLGVLAGLVSLGCQCFMADVNPLAIATAQPKQRRRGCASCPPTGGALSILKDASFLTFLLYFGLWTFAVNLSAPFFNLYLLDNLSLDLGWVTLYTSLTSGANLVMMMLWGKLADRIGNRPLLLLVGILVAMTPLFWLSIGTDSVSLWVLLPLLHLLTGGTCAAIDLCSSNIQMELAPSKHPSTYFAIAAAVAGVSGGLGITAGGQLAQLDQVGGLPGLFALSAVVRLMALLPLVLVPEPRSQPVVQVMRNFLTLPGLSTCFGRASQNRA